MVTSRFAFLLSPLVGDDLASQLWYLLDAPDASAERVLEKLAATGVKNIPDFALVEVADVAKRTVVCFSRGVAKIKVSSGSERQDVEIVGSDSVIWAEAQITGARALHLFAGPEPAPTGGLALARGVVRSNSIRL